MVSPAPGLTNRGLLMRAGVYLVLLATLGPLGGRDTSIGPAEAAATAAVLRWIGVGVTRVDDVLAGPTFAMRVAPVCDGLDLALILGLAILVSPVSWRARAVGLALAVLVTQAFNLVRLASTFLVALYKPQYFDVVHQVVWQVVAIVVAVGLYAAWLDRALAPAPRVR